MYDIDPRPASRAATVRRPTGRTGRSSLIAGAIAVALLPVIAGCDSDDDPADPASSVPSVETGTTPSDGVTVTLEPGSNLPPGGGEGGDDGDGVDTDMDVDGDGTGESDGDDNEDG